MSTTKQNSDETKEFKLNTNQHENIVNEVRMAYRNQVDGKLTFKPNFKNQRNKSKLEEVVQNKPNLFVEEENEEKEIIICLKRKRDETPLEELFIEAPKNKRKTMKEIMNEFENMNFKNEHLIHKFTLFQSNEKEIESTKDLIENIKKRKNFKIIEMNENKNKIKQEKLKEKVKENRLISINKSRQDDVNILKVQFEEKMEPFLNLLEKFGEKIEIEKEEQPDDFNYDYYYLTEKVKENIENIPNLIQFDETLTFEDEYYSNEDDSDIDSIDSNREDHPWNDYPEDEEEVYTSEEDELNDDWKRYESDEWNQEEDEEYDYEL